MMNRFKNSFVFFFIFLILFFLGCNNDEEITKDSADSFVTNFVENISANNLKQTVEWMQNKGSRFFLNDNHRQLALAIKNKFIQLGYSNARLDSFSLSVDWDNETYNTWQYNVIASIQGSSNPENIYVMGAHYDCIVDEGDPFENAPGANDNASGLAAVIEVARVFKTQAFVPKNTIEFVAFAAEENDLNGSADYTRKAASSSENIVMMLNNDMVATATGSESSWTVNVMDYSNSSSLRSDFVACGELYTNLNFSHDNSYNKDGDSYSFFDEGFKAIFIISDADDGNYHTTNDIVENCNFDFCREVTAVSCAMLVQENK